MTSAIKSITLHYPDGIKPAAMAGEQDRAIEDLCSGGQLAFHQDNHPPYHIDLMRRRVAIEGRDIELTQREFDLATYLFRRQGRIVSRDALLENVWNMSAQVSTRTVDTHVSRLRKKLELGGEHGWRLTAVYQHGYRLEQS